MQSYKIPHSFLLAHSISINTLISYFSNYKVWLESCPHWHSKSTWMKYSLLGKTNLLFKQIDNNYLLDIIIANSFGKMKKDSDIYHGSLSSTFSSLSYMNDLSGKQSWIYQARFSRSVLFVFFCFNRPPITVKVCYIQNL